MSLIWICEVQYSKTCMKYNFKKPMFVSFLHIDGSNVWPLKIKFSAVLKIFSGLQTFAVHHFFKHSIKSLRMLTNPDCGLSIYNQQHQRHEFLICIKWNAQKTRSISMGLMQTFVFTFGRNCVWNVLQLIHKYLEVDTFHRVVYIGQETGSLATQLEDYFCLTNPIRSVFPGRNYLHL